MNVGVNLTVVLLEILLLRYLNSIWPIPATLWTIFGVKLTWSMPVLCLTVNSIESDYLFTYTHMHSLLLTWTALSSRKAVVLCRNSSNATTFTTTLSPGAANCEIQRIVLASIGEIKHNNVGMDLQFALLLPTRYYGQWSVCSNRNDPIDQNLVQYNCSSYSKKSSCLESPRRKGCSRQTIHTHLRQTHR